MIKCDQAARTPLVKAMPKVLALLGISIATISAGYSQGVLFDNGTIVTAGPPVTGLPAGASASALQTALGLNFYGFGNAKAAGLRVADNFVVPANASWEISSVQVYGYQTGSSTTSSITNTNLRIWNGAPNAGGAILYDGSAGNQQTSSVFSTIYRILDTGTPGTGRPVMVCTALVPGALTLSTGTYWLDWQHDGSTSFSGPWSVPVTIVGQTGKAGADALQFDPTANPTWYPVIDTGSTGTSNFPQDLAFKVLGYYVLKPTGYLVTQGTQTGGTLNSLFAIDTDRILIQCDELAPNGQIEIYTTAPSTSTTNFTFTHVAAASRTDMTEKLQLWNWTLNGGSGGWDPTVQNTRSTTLSDSAVNLTVTVNPSNYINSSTREMRARITTTPNAEVDGFDGWNTRINYARWRLSP